MKLMMSQAWAPQYKLEKQCKVLQVIQPAPIPRTQILSDGNQYRRCTMALTNEECVQISSNSVLQFLRS